MIRDMRVSPSMAISLLALTVALGGTSVAVERSGDDQPATAAAKKKRGPRGPQGPVGPQGPAGLQGQRGEQGIQGLQGIPGPTFADFTQNSGETDPPPEPGGVVSFRNTITTPSAGRLLVMLDGDFIPICDTGPAVMGLYVNPADDAPTVAVPGTARSATSGISDHFNMIGVTGPLPAGTYSVELDGTCGSGPDNFGVSTLAGDYQEVGAVLLGS